MPKFGRVFVRVSASPVLLLINSSNGILAVDGQARGEGSASHKHVAKNKAADAAWAFLANENAT